MDLFRVFMLLSFLGSVYSEFYVADQDITIDNGSSGVFILLDNTNTTINTKITFNVTRPDVLNLARNTIIAKPGESKWIVEFVGEKPGAAVIKTIVENSSTEEYSKAFVHVTVQKSELLYKISFIIGWIYFFAWSISFYPQIYTNYKRKSVVGLNFDFLSLNLVGFIMYSLFNCGLYWIPEIEKQYAERYPTSLNPVQMNDIFFGLHAIFATVVTILQCFIYDIGTQRVSSAARFIHTIFFSIIIISVILAYFNRLEWLEFLYYCSYIKLAITLIKYVPQAFYNYKRQSTVGWSIGNILLDFTGGILSDLQLIINAYNYDDWQSISGDRVKFGLGLFSVVFDVFFMIQHYILYRDREDYRIIPGENHDNQEDLQENENVDDMSE